jgi:voltage-gated potassium channel
MNAKRGTSSAQWRESMRVIIFEADTPAGKLFDVLLIVSILLSVGAVMLDTVEAVQTRYGVWLLTLEWFFTILFTIEYALRLACAPRPLGYARSFFGVVDLLAILPTYASLLLPGSHYLLVIRILRVLRVFRVLKLVQYVGEANVLATALRASRHKILVFLLAILALVVILGSLMYLIEGREHGFSSIPKSIYWAVVTLTTVGYGDVSPQTPLGQGLALLVMIAGYSIIAVPTGIVSVELGQAVRRATPGRTCGTCAATGHAADALYCKQCGAPLAGGDDGRAS